MTETCLRQVYAVGMYVSFGSCTGTCTSAPSAPILLNSYLPLSLLVIILQLSNAL
jgi:hypothetical protein